ncbi:hypothetical protein OROGR_010888 [Orobanche gracilis]
MLCENPKYESYVALITVLRLVVATVPVPILQSIKMVNIVRPSHGDPRNVFRETNPSF